MPKGISFKLFTCIFYSPGLCVKLYKKYSLKYAYLFLPNIRFTKAKCFKTIAAASNCLLLFPVKSTIVSNEPNSLLFINVGKKFDIKNNQLTCLLLWFQNNNYQLILFIALFALIAYLLFNLYLNKK